MKQTGDLILAIETIIEGGSFSVFDKAEGTEIIGWTGENKISKAEDVLENLSFLNESAGISKKSIKLVLCAAGAGSATGFKIGSAIAKGFAKSIECRSVEVSLWRAFSKMLKTSEVSAGADKIFYLPFGRDRVFRRVLSGGDYQSNGEIISLEQFLDEMENISTMNTHGYVYASLLKFIKREINYRIHPIEKNLAKQIAAFASDNESGIS